MKKISKLLIVATAFMFVMIVGLLDPEEVYGYAYTTLYLEVGETYTQSVSCSSPVFDAYGTSDETVCTATWDKEKLANRTAFTIKAKAAGSATFYVCNNGSSTEANRVRTVKVYVYNTSSSTLNLTNSTSATNSTKTNVPIYLYVGKTSSCSLTQSVAYPTSVSGDTSGNAKAQATTFASSNTAVATVTSNGVVTGVGQGVTTLSVKRTWTTSTGKTISSHRQVSVYVYAMPSLTIYNGNTAISSLSFTMIQNPSLTYKLANMQSTDTISSVIGTSADTNKFTISLCNGSFLFTPKTVTNGTVNAIFTVVLNSVVSTHNGAGEATFTKTIPVEVLPDTTVYVTDVTFTNNSVEMLRGETYQQSAIVIPGNATNSAVTYTSSNTRVATVATDGTVTAKGCGTATITATSQQVSSKSARYTITVMENPTEITSITNTEKGLKIEWSEINGASSYQLWRCTELNGSYTLLRTCTGTIYTDESGEYGVTYYYKVAVIPSEGSSYMSSFSNIVSAQKCVEVPIIQSVEKIYDYIQVKLSTSTSCDGYVIYNGKSNKTLLGSTATQTATLNLDEGTYYLSSRAYKVVNGKKVYSDYSNIITFTVTAKKVTITTTNASEETKKSVTVKKPNKTKIKKIKSKKKALRIKVKKIKNATGFEVKYSSRSTFKNAKVKRFKTNKFTLKKLKTKKKYYIKIRVYKVINNKTYYSKYTKVRIKKTK